MTSKDVLRKIVLEQKNLFQQDYVPREQLELIKSKESSGFVSILSGIRRCGKSVLMKQLRDLSKEGDYYLNFDDERLFDFEVGDFEKLYEVFVELFGEQSVFYFDEIQNISGWESFVRRLHDYGNRIYITGSNANLLSKELGTRLTGRYLGFELFPASFREFLVYRGFDPAKLDIHLRTVKASVRKSFDEYLERGGFFKYLQTEDSDFFRILYENILYRDIITRHSLSHERGIKDIFHYLVSNISKEFSFTTLKKISGISSITTIKDYVSFLEDGYLMFSIPIYDRSVKKQLVNPKKAYVIDTGLASSISFRFSEDAGRILENVVFLELKRLGKEIFYHRQNCECDFVIKEGLEIVSAIQVCLELDVNNRDREINGLVDAMDAYGLDEGLLLTLDDEDSFTVEGKKVIVKPVWKWLLEASA